MRGKFEVIVRVLILGILGTFVLYVPEVKAQGKSTLRVLVTSEGDGAPVVGATMSLVEIAKEEREGERYNGVTDGSGLEEFGGVASGRYALSISHVSHESYSDTLTLGHGERRLERVALSVETQQVGTVVVTDERDVTTGEAGVRRIDRQDIRRVPTSGGGLVPYLQTLPSVGMAGSRGGNLYVRGGKPTQNHALVDGVPIVKPFHISNIYSPIPSSLISGVDFYAGGFSAKYLEKTSSVLDISLRPGDMRKYKASAELSPYISRIEMEGPIKGKDQSFIVSARRSLINESSSLVGLDKGLEFYDIIGKYSLLKENFKCGLASINSFDEGRIDPNRNNVIRWKNNSLGLNCLGFSSEYASQFEVTAAYSTFSNSEYKGKEKVRNSGSGNFVLGIDVKDENVKNTLEYGFEVGIYQYKAKLDEEFAGTSSLNEVLSVFRYHVLYEWEIGDVLSVEPSVGFQIPMLDIKLRPEPRIRISYSPSNGEKQEISLAAGRYYQLSSGYNDVREAGSAFHVLKPYRAEGPRQTSLHGIIGYERSLFREVTVSVESYWKKHRNILVSEWTPRIGGTFETARANSISYGLDTRIKYEGNNLYSYIGYGWSKVEYRASSDDLGAWIESPVLSYSPVHDRRHRLNLMSSYRLGGYTFSLRWAFGTGRPFTKVYGYDLLLDLPDELPTTDPGTARIFYDRPYGGRLPTYHRLDLSVERLFQLGEDWSLDSKLGVINIYNRDNVFYLNPETLRVTRQIPVTPYVNISLNYN